MAPTRRWCSGHTSTRWRRPLNVSGHNGAAGDARIIEIPSPGRPSSVRHLARAEEHPLRGHQTVAHRGIDCWTDTENLSDLLGDSGQDRPTIGSTSSSGRRPFMPAKAKPLGCDETGGQRAGGRCRHPARPSAETSAALRIIRRSPATLRAYARGNGNRT